MGLLKLTLTLSLPLLLALGCKQPDERPDCAKACDYLDGCGLLPSPLGTGRNAKANCTERCVLSEPGVADPVLACYRLEAVRDSEMNWCPAGGACTALGACLGEMFPGEDPTGVGLVEVRVGVDLSRSATSPDECHEDATAVQPLASRNPADCAIGGVTDIMLFPIPGADPIDRRQRQRACPDAVGAAFPPVQAPAGAFQARLKLIGPGPSLELLDAGLADAGDAATPVATATVARCKILRAPAIGVAAGKTTLVNVNIPRDWTESSFLGACEADCFDSLDNDGDGASDCSDPACQSECSPCRLTPSADGRLLPDCSEPACPCFTPIDAGALRPLANGTGGADTLDATNAANLDAGATPSPAIDASDDASTRVD